MVNATQVLREDVIIEWVQKSKKKRRGTDPITTWSLNLFVFTRIESVQYTCDRIVFTLPTYKIYRPNIKMYVRTVNTFVLLRQSIYMLQTNVRIMWWFTRHCAHFSLYVVCIWWLPSEFTKICYVAKFYGISWALEFESSEED